MEGRRRRHDMDAAVAVVGELGPSGDHTGALSSQKATNARSVVMSGERPTVDIDRPEVGSPFDVEHESDSGAVRAQGRMMGAGRGEHVFQSPVVGRWRSGRAWLGMPPNTSLPSHRGLLTEATSETTGSEKIAPPRVSAEGVKHRHDVGAEGIQVVTALLDQDRGLRQGGKTSPISRKPWLLTRSGLSGSDAPESTPRETTRNSGSRPGDSVADLVEAGEISRCRRCPAPMGRSDWPLLPPLRRSPQRSHTSGETNPHPDRHGSSGSGRRFARRRSPGSRCRGGRRCRRSPPALLPGRSANGPRSPHC